LVTVFNLNYFNHIWKQLNNNQLNVIDANIFKGLNLKYIDLSFNKIFSIHSLAFKLTIIDSNVFKDLTSLEYLDLSNQFLVGIQAKAFQGLMKLKSLNLSFNEIKYFNDTNIFQGLSNLNTLALNSNKLVLFFNIKF